MTRFPGGGQQIAQRLHALGYVRRDGQPDIRRFCRMRAYDPRGFYPWLNQGQISSDSNLHRLATALELPSFRRAR